MFTQIPQVDGLWCCCGEGLLPWTLELLEVDISVVAVIIAAALWGQQWSTDIMAVVASLQQRLAKSPPLMHLMHYIYIYIFCAFMGFIIVLGIYLEYSLDEKWNFLCVLYQDI